MCVCVWLRANNSYFIFTQISAITDVKRKTRKGPDQLRIVGTVADNKIRTIKFKIIEERLIYDLVFIRNHVVLSFYIFLLYFFRS